MAEYRQMTFADLAPLGPRPGEYRMPPNAELKHCSSCGAEIVWSTTAWDRAVPLSVATIQTRNGVQYLPPHFVDCPHAAQWSGRGRKKRSKP